MLPILLVILAALGGIRVEAAHDPEPEGYYVKERVYESESEGAYLYLVKDATTRLGVKMYYLFDDFLYNRTAVDELYFGPFCSQLDDLYTNRAAPRPDMEFYMSDNLAEDTFKTSRKPNQPSDGLKEVYKICRSLGFPLRAPLM